jgi:uncharacterized protein YggE
MRIYLVAAAIALVSCPSIGLAQGTSGSFLAPSMMIHGQGRVEVPPDYANVTVEVDTRGKTAAAATSSHETRATRAMNLLQELKPQGVEIVRSNFRLTEQRNPPTPASSNRPPENEYLAITSFELKMTRMDAVDAATTKIAASDLFLVRNSIFRLNADNASIDAARKRAVDDARRKAAAYADAAGVQLGEILRIEDLEAQPPAMFAGQALAARSVQIVPPESLTLTASVTITWRIAGKP